MKYFAKNFLLFLSLITLSACSPRTKNEVLQEALPMPGGKVRNFSEFIKRDVPVSAEQSFLELINSYAYIIIDFYSNACGPCKVVGKLLDNIAPHHPSILIVKINIDDFESIAHQFNIRSIPTLLFYKNSILVKRLNGSHKDKILDAIKTLFN